MQGRAGSPEHAALGGGWGGSGLRQRWLGPPQCDFSSWTRGHPNPGDPGAPRNGEGVSLSSGPLRGQRSVVCTRLLPTVCLCLVTSRDHSAEPRGPWSLPVAKCQSKGHKTQVSLGVGGCWPPWATSFRSGPGHRACSPAPRSGAGALMGVADP